MLRSFKMSGFLKITMTLAAGVFLATSLGCDRTQRAEFNGGEIFYNKTVSKDEVAMLGSFLVECNFFDGARKSIELVRKDDVIQFRMVVIEGYEDDQEYADLCADFIDGLSIELFDGEEVVMHLCDDHLRTLRVIDNRQAAKLAQAVLKSDAAQSKTDK